MAYRDDDQLEALARELRKRLGVDEQTIPDMMTVIVKAKSAGLIRDYERVANGTFPNGKDAEFDPDTGVLRILELEFRSMNRGTPKGRFTVAHEISHAFLGHTEARYRSAPGQALRVRPQALVRDEHEANYVGSAFLTPPHLLSSDPHQMSAAQIAAHFQVSRTLAEIRKPGLERIYRIENGISRPLPQSVIDFLNATKRRD